MKRKKQPIAKKALKVAFYGAAAGVGILLAVRAARKKGSLFKKGGEKLIRKTKHTFKSVTDGLNARQRKILSLFDREEEITNEMVQSVIKGVTERTIRRDLNHLEEKGYIRKKGKTKGSYYVLC
jgi:predicted HTH transcriptional regulator